jgi:hypothetical protein
MNGDLISGASNARSVSIRKTESLNLYKPDP